MFVKKRMKRKKEYKEILTRLKKVMKTKPRKFQIKGIMFMEKMNGRALLGDDRGLGKTIQVLGYLAINPELRPAIIACPANAKYEWEEQLFQHTKNLDCQVLTGQKPYPIKKDIIIVNYDILSYWENVLINLNPVFLGLDEAHYIKNLKAKRTASCQKIGKNINAIIPMSGTPIVNKPVEYFPVLNMICPKEFPSFWKYAFRYCDPKKGFRGQGWRFDGATNTKDLYNRVKPFMIRRLKEEVLPELPPKQRIYVPIEISNRREYDKASKDFLKWYEEEYGRRRKEKAKKSSALVKIGKLKELAEIGKLKTAIEWIDEFLETTDEKLVIFCFYSTVFEQITKHYSKIACLGRQSGRKRKEAIKQFQSDNTKRLFIGTISADKEAITLTAASTSLFIGMGFTPGGQDQAEDRILRIGQEASSVNIYYLIGRNTIDEYVWDIIEKKRKIVSQIIDGKEVDSEIQKMVSLDELMSNIYKKRRVS